MRTVDNQHQPYCDLGSVDMGAYEFHLIHPCPWDCQTSASGPDNLVGINDFLDVLAQWGRQCTSCDFDPGSPDHVGIQEFLALLANWGACPALGLPAPPTLQEELDDA